MLIDQTLSIPVLSGFFVLGLVILAFGAEMFIRGAVRIARKLGVSPFIIGLTLVGFGTSAPELVVNLSAANNGEPNLAIGNVVGSNIANVGLILGIAALIRPLKAQSRLLRVEIPIVIVASLAFWYMAYDDGIISRIDALILLGGFVAVSIYIAFSAKNAPHELEEAVEANPHKDSTFVSIIMLLIGLVALVGGAELMVETAVGVATQMGVSPLIIGVTIVAIGTSLPELAATLAAAYRGQADIAVGNIVGSNMFNILLIIGTTGTIIPLTVDHDAIYREFPIMVGFMVLSFLVIVKGLKIHRWEGFMLLALYIGFLVWQVMLAQSAPELPPTETIPPV